MSATNRGAVRKPHDFYPTPEDTTRLLMRWLGDQQIRVNTVLDPAAGDGAILRLFDCERFAYEVREECRAGLESIASTFIIDALSPGMHEPSTVDLVCANTPFSLAREFVTAYRYVGRTSAFLLRLGFLASQSRAPWWAEDPPAHVLVLPSRPSFTGDGKSDAADYMWAVWRGKTPKGYTRLDWLVTP